jgi:hypothetical protein
MLEPEEPAARRPGGEPTAETAPYVGPQGMTAPNVGPQGEKAPGMLMPDARDQDVAREALEDELTTEPSRPLTAEERRAAEAARPAGERVYAPASERVPRAPALGHRDLAGQVDPTTPERRAAPTTWYGTSEADTGQEADTGFAARLGRYRPALLFAVVWLGVAVWTVVIYRLLDEWQRRRNRPAARLQRQARRAAKSLQPVQQRAAGALEPAQRRVRSLRG